MKPRAKRSFPRRKVRIFGPVRCNVLMSAPYLETSHFSSLRTENMMPDRRFLLATVAGLFGLAAFRWLRAEPAQAAEKFEIDTTDAEWRAQLTPPQADILRQTATDPRGSSPQL